MPAYTKYQRLRLGNAWKKTWKDFAPTREHILLAIVIAAAGFGLQAVFYGWQETKNELLLTLLKSVAAVALVMVAWFAIRVAIEPFSMWKEADRKAAKLQNQLLNNQDHKKVAADLQRLIVKGNEIASRIGSPVVGPLIDRWREEVNEVLKHVPEGDAAMFNTLYPIRPDVRSASAHKDLHHMMTVLNNKLRMIMSRAYGRADLIGDDGVPFNDVDAPTD
jgi:hypothetical protein